jgi:hypothetical protein
MVIFDNLGIHTPKGSRLLRALLAELGELGEQLVLVYTPTYDPDVTLTPTASSGCGAACAARSPTLTNVNAWRTWWPTPTSGRARSLRRRCCRRLAARSHPTSSRI